MAGVAFSAQAQSKIAHANISYVLSRMPEMQSMNQSLETLRTQLGKKLEIKQKYAQEKYQEYLKSIENIKPGTEPGPEIKKMEEELTALQKEIQDEAAAADEKLAKKQADLMAPITEKLDNTLKEVAATEGYDYVLNTIDGSGVSIVLFGPEERDLTKKLMTKLNIPIQEEGK